jgi:methionyl-tRNA formyltransferase
MGAPVVSVASMAPEGVAAIHEARPGVIVVACFPWRLPRAVLELPHLGCLNIHPSLLPRWRGPDPVFWAYRQGDRETGVTVHQMEGGFDTGPILAQQPMAIPVGSRAPELARTLMAAGGRLVAELLPELARGAVMARPQDDSLATPAPVPAAADFELPTTWPAERAYAFAAGVAPLGGPLAVRLATGERLPVRDATIYAVDDSIAPPPVSGAKHPGEWLDEGQGIIQVRFSDGWVRFLRAGCPERAIARYPVSLSPPRARDIR